MWYGLKKNEEIVAVKFFTYTPTVFDFDIYHSSQNKYEIVEVKILEK